ncbi:PaaI family thioesterase [Prescottella sp. R16]|uniref:PaaI family thioesterase n=1 Tax=Prescottella sp. R16 TaxID=3064529 RepID=UPI00272E6510|nr:PaaI family thioesterase [Prescottella sp. R16]
MNTSVASHTATASNTTTVSRTAREWIEGVLVASPVARHLGLRTVRAEVDRVDLALDFRDDLTTVPGVLHGGVLATLVDTAAAAASASGLDEADPAAGGATTHLNVTFVTAATGRHLTATAVVTYRTRSTTHSTVTVRDVDGTLVVTATATSRIFR